MYTTVIATANESFITIIITAANNTDVTATNVTLAVIRSNAAYFCYIPNASLAETIVTTAVLLPVLLLLLLFFYPKNIMTSDLTGDLTSFKMKKNYKLNFSKILSSIHCFVVLFTMYSSPKLVLLPL